MRSKTLRESQPAPEVWRLWKNWEDQRILEMLWDSSCTHFKKNLGRDFSDNWLQSRVARKMADHILKTMCPNMYQTSVRNDIKNHPKTEKIRVWRVFWEVWGLPGAMSSRLGSRSGKMPARSYQKCSIWWEF